MFGIGMPEVILVLAVGLILLGNRLPAMARYLGKGLLELKKGMSGLEEEVTTTVK